MEAAAWPFNALNSRPIPFLRVPIFPLHRPSQFFFLFRSQIQIAQILTSGLAHVVQIMFARIEEELLNRGYIGCAVKLQTAAKFFEVFYRPKAPQKEWIKKQVFNESETMDFIQADGARA